MFSPSQNLRKVPENPDQIMRGPAGNQYRNADWNRICLDNVWDVRTQKHLSADCYQSAVGGGAGLVIDVLHLRRWALDGPVATSKMATDRTTRLNPR
jgi:hypothetical protein